MSIWGVGYGSVPLRVRNYSVIFENGELNTETYGNFLPTDAWEITGGNLRIKTGRTAYFELPCNAQFIRIVYSTIKETVNPTMRLKIGSTQRGNDYYDQIMPAGITDYHVELENIPTPFYITISVDSTTASSGRLISKFVLE